MVFVSSTRVLWLVGDREKYIFFLSYRFFGQLVEFFKFLTECSAPMICWVFNFGGMILMYPVAIAAEFRRLLSLGHQAS